ncbi:GTP-binding protein gtr2 [Spiromyces aspiralis]|uniref:GTP-binding protein gtr2 n=1 Tax=Spiromyces aspiralis TaxID=68401 RepID=A0ACC1HC20_9FUNG|nr:GTP-binding protein gtr2 [Spiromyces aspiralis]
MMKFFGAENFDYTLSFYTTSIYDRSMYEAITQVIGDLVPNKPYIENVLSTFCNTSMMEKAFLFDRDTRICLAGDVLSIDNDAFRFCSDTLLMLEDMFRIMWSEIKDEQMKEEYRRDNPKSKIKPHRGFVTLDGSEYMYAYQVDRSLIMVSVGKDRSTMKDALLEYNAAQTAKGIRKILTRKTTTTPYIDILINDYENKQSGVAEARGYEPPAAPTNPQ